MASEASTSNGDSEALFVTDIANNVVNLRNVILNEFHVLRKFSFISLCNETLCVKLESDLGSQIGFQIENENFDHENVAEQTVATFLADDFNQLFNTVNLVSEVILQPRQVQQVILTFRPSEPVKGLPKEKDEKEINQTTRQNESNEPLKRLSANVTEIFQVNGNLSFSASILGDSVESGNGEATRIKNQKINVQFNSTVCRSWILQIMTQDFLFQKETSRVFHIAVFVSHTNQKKLGILLILSIFKTITMREIPNLSPFDASSILSKDKRDFWSLALEKMGCWTLETVTQETGRANF